MWVFILSLMLLLSTPGPGVLSLAGVGSAFGYHAGMRYGLGLFIGSNSVLLVAALGLGALLLADDRLRLVFSILSMGYLLYLAFNIAFAGTKIAFIEKKHAPGFWGGILLQIINPKAYAVGTFVFSNFPLWPNSHFVEVALKFLILNAIWIPVHGIWLAIGVGIHRLQLQQKTQRTINMVMAVAMVMVVILAMWASF